MRNAEDINISDSTRTPYLRETDGWVGLILQSDIYANTHKYCFAIT